MQELPHKMVFTIRDTLKTTRPGKQLEPIQILAYGQDPRLCLVVHTKQYLVKTHALRKTSSLLISLAGIDVSTFSAHSSRTAASSYGLLSGLPLQDIFKAGGRSNAQVFA